MQFQIIRRLCDNPSCGQKEDFDGNNLRPDAEAKLSCWVLLSKEHVLQSGQPPQPLSKHGCCASCAVEIIRQALLDLPKSKKPSEAN